MPKPSHSTVEVVPSPLIGEWLTRAFAVAVIALVLGALAISWLRETFRDRPFSPSLIPVAFTREGDEEGTPAFSPDGRWVVYASARSGLFIKPARDGDSVARRLTLTTPPASSAYEAYPAWSPDGTRIAFQRQIPSGGGYSVMVVTPEGGDLRTLTTMRGIGLAWMADGRELAVSDRRVPGEPLSILRIAATNSASARAGDRVGRLTQPPLGTHGDMYPAFSPDGQWLAFARYTTRSAADVFIAPAKGGDARRLTDDEAEIEGLTWTPDSQAIVFASDRARDGSQRLWMISRDRDVAGSGEAQLVAAGEGQGKFPAFSPAKPGESARLAYTFGRVDVNVWRFVAGDSGTRGVRAGIVAPASDWDDHPALSPDGRHLAFISNRNGPSEIFISDADGSEPRQLTFRGGPRSESPQWSPDGQSIAFASYASVNSTNSDIFVIGASGGTPRRLTTEASAEDHPSWSRDGRSIYFRSDRTGRSEIWKMAADSDGGRDGGGAGDAVPAVHAVRMTRGGGSQAFESFDGRHLLFVRDARRPGLWRMPLHGGKPARLALPVRQDQWAVVDGGVCFIAPRGKQPFAGTPLACHEEATGITSTHWVITGDRDAIKSGFAASRDRRQFYWSHIDRSEADLMMIYNWPFDSRTVLRPPDRSTRK